MSVSIRLPSPDLITGTLLLCLSGVLFWACTGIKDFGAVGVGSAFVPRLTASLLLVISLVLMCNGWAKRSEPKKADVAEENSRVFAGVPAVGVSILLMAGYLALLEPLGYLFASMLYGFLQILVLTKDAKRNYMMFAVLAVCSAAAFYYLFVQLFEISLPSGVLG
ncbi:tripartite tricarboxylate transporter TctB family protein [Pseudomonas sp. NPDC078700]|uniref:tripartite tricarboxylate transporter TctB family protein n=1 Tax=Pseudomonas sp. NPDC078700 TaxID=3364424 RepID=UPI0037C6B7B0